MKKNVRKLFVLLMALLVVGCGKKDEAVTNESDSGSERS